MTPLDWAGLLQAGLQGLRLTPDAFWRLTPAELSIMLGIGAGRRPMGRTALDDLMAAYPDGPKGDTDDE